MQYGLLPAPPRRTVFMESRNYCPAAQSLCFGFGNTLTSLVANSIYNSGEVTIERKAGDVTFLAAYTLAKSIDNSSGFNDLINFENPSLAAAFRPPTCTKLRGQLHLADAIRSNLPRQLPTADERMATAGHHPFLQRLPNPDGQGESRRCRTAVSIGGCATGDASAYRQSRPLICRMSWDRFTSRILAATPGHGRISARAHLPQPPAT